jgi:hypothetical protein
MMMKNTDEIRRLVHGPQENEVPDGLLLRTRAECDGEADAVLRSLREVWATALWTPDPGRLSTQDWKLILPRWFVAKFEPEIKTDDPLLQRAFQLQDKMRADGAWTLAEWVRSLDPATRSWAWWKAQSVAPSVFEVTVVLRREPSEMESLHWSLRCAGARSVTLVE